MTHRKATRRWTRLAGALFFGLAGHTAHAADPVILKHPSFEVWEAPRMPADIDMFDAFKTTCQVEIRVKSNGRPRNPAITGCPVAFGRMIYLAAKDWRYAPHLVDGKKTSFIHQTAFEFRLRAGAKAPDPVSVVAPRLSVHLPLYDMAIELQETTATMAGSKSGETKAVENMRDCLNEPTTYREISSRLTRTLNLFVWAYQVPVERVSCTVDLKVTQKGTVEEVGRVQCPNLMWETAEHNFSQWRFKMKVDGVPREPFECRVMLRMRAKKAQPGSKSEWVYLLVRAKQ